ncbi:serine/threonine-protein kinase rio2 isoform X1 [Cucurbita moschata]|uniref:Serine/threonine-protein kinase RIO2 n=1 Tax=Cucurbita moschata TaxID=3662 RepID=A0A6J1E5R3_CUCMO|nr:serine/threonine-protein kinase rio2 isoform X1 [Cucurbita moschata]
MKLDVNVLRYLSKDDFRVLTAVEMGMRNHEIVPSELVERIASLRHGGTYKVLKNLLKYKLLHHDSSKYDGFRLTYLGYDFLAIKTLVNRGVFVAVGRQIGVGKESDIFEVAKEDGTVLAMKLHRLGRISFRSVKSKRDYLRHRSSYNWLYLSRLAAVKEFAFMKALEEHGFPVPNAVDSNRHCVIMSLVEGYPLVQVKQLQNPDVVFETIIGLVVRLAEHGLIHCDFNEFNIMINDDEKVTMIDFPQMVSVSHRNAQMYFDRDVECVFKFFRKRFNLSFHETVDDENDVEIDNDESARPCFSSISKGAGSLDKELAASGFTRKEQEDIEKFIEGGLEEDADSGEEEAESSKLNEMDTNAVEHLRISVEETLSGDENVELQGNHETCLDDVSENDSDSNQNQEANETGILENSSSETRDDEGEARDENDDTELNKRLNKQRQRAIASASGGRKGRASRNTYKDKGRKSSNNSKIHKQIGLW